MWPDLYSVTEVASVMPIAGRCRNLMRARRILFIELLFSFGITLRWHEKWLLQKLVTANVFFNIFFSIFSYLRPLWPNSVRNFLSGKNQVSCWKWWVEYQWTNRSLVNSFSHKVVNSVKQWKWNSWDVLRIFRHIKIKKA